MKVVIVHINPGEETVIGIYVDGILKNSGDYHFDKIDIWIDGYLEGLYDGGQEFDLAHTNITEDKQVDNYCECGTALPKLLTKLEPYFEN